MFLGKSRCTRPAGSPFGVWDSAFGVRGSEFTGQMLPGCAGMVAEYYLFQGRRPGKGEIGGNIVIVCETVHKPDRTPNSEPRTPNAKRRKAEGPRFLPCFFSPVAFWLLVLLGEQETLERVLRDIEPIGIEKVSLSEASNRVVAEDIRATVALPPFDNSTMDGYAVRSTDAVRGARLKITGEQPAGTVCGLRVEQGCAIRIFTGAPIPEGADAVVMQEEVDRAGQAIVVREAVHRGEFIRVRGGDLCEGQTLVSRGDVLSGPKRAAIASQGLNRLDVFRRPKVKIVATGSELQSQGKPIGTGQIYETNRILIADAVADSGADAEIFDIVPDTEGAHQNAFERARGSDVIVVAGGVSVGEKDLVKPTLLKLGAQLHLWRIAVKPGKPFMFGQWDRTLVFGLPGNPVSAFVTFLLFVRPALWKLGGRASLEMPRFQAKVDRDLVNAGDRPHYLRGIYFRGTFRPVGKQESHALFALSLSNALCRLEADQIVAANSLVDIIPL
jgi:molybdopterin molybdotransferase